MAAPGVGATAVPRSGPRGATRGVRSAAAASLALASFLVVIGLCRLVWADPSHPVALTGRDPLPAAGWAVVAVSGPVVYRATGTEDWHALQRAQVLAPGFEVVTGAGGFAKLVRALDQVTIDQNTHLIFPAEARSGSGTRIFQLLGMAFFEVTKRMGWDFEVKTPFLAAVVKGTSFGVSVDRGGASVAVEGGLVGVSSAATGESANVGPGLTASVSATAGGVSVSASRDAPVSAPLAAALAGAATPDAAAPEAAAESDTAAGPEPVDARRDRPGRSNGDRGGQEDTGKGGSGGRGEPEGEDGGKGDDPGGGAPGGGGPGGGGSGGDDDD